LDNYTNEGSRDVYDEIALKLIEKMDCWEDPIDSSNSNPKKKCWNTRSSPPGNFINEYRKGWSFQRGPLGLDEKTESQRYFDEPVSNPLGNDLLFLARFLLKE